MFNRILNKPLHTVSNLLNPLVKPGEMSSFRRRISGQILLKIVKQAEMMGCHIWTTNKSFMGFFCHLTKILTDLDVLLAML